jgi:hypothetical protein
MANKEQKHQFYQLDIFKQELEKVHLRRKTLIVNITLFVLIAFVVSFVLIEGIPFSKIAVTLLIYGFLLFFTLLFTSIKSDEHTNLYILMYSTIISIYGIAITMILEFETPSVFTILFLAYALTTIYQDVKAMLLSSTLMFLIGGMIIIQNPDVLIMAASGDPQIFYVLTFLIVFILLLTLSSFILIKRKTFFYNQIASIKESEIRNIRLLRDLQNKSMDHGFSLEQYYDSLLEFSKHLSKKIGVEDLFGRRIKLLEDLKKYTQIEIEEMYHDFNSEEIESIKKLAFEVDDKMFNTAMKASKSNNITVDKKEIFNESLFKSMNHIGDSTYTKIISFAIFYTLLKINKPYLNRLSEEEIKHIISNSEYYYLIDKDIVSIYIDNSEVFDAIVQDVLNGGDEL